jgi:HSP20 family protein
MLGLIPRNRVKEFFPPAYGPLFPRMELPFFLGKFREEFEKFFDPFVGMAPPVKGWPWALDVEEKEEAVFIRAEAPGFEPADFELQIQEGYLILSACHKKEFVEKGKPMFKEERVCREVVVLPPFVLPEKITAVYKNGVLIITLPRKPEAKGVKVPVLPG